jgi:hypothetical protein
VNVSEIRACCRTHDFAFEPKSHFARCSYSRVLVVYQVAIESWHMGTSIVASRSMRELFWYFPALAAFSLCG